MRDPKDLKAFQLADALVFEVYRLSATFPADERFGLTSQVRRAAVSVASNLVEGCSRDSQADFKRFVDMATGSAMELRYQLTIARRFGWCSANEVSACETHAGEVCKVLIGLGKALRAETSNLVPGTYE
jgi:S23 ribosomal protein.